MVPDEDRVEKRLLWHSNAPHAPTGYGNQTSLFTPRLNKHFKVGMSAFYGIEGNVLPWNGMPVLPAYGGDLGDETISGHVASWLGGPRDGVVMTLMDCWALDAAIWSKFNLACWTPIDHEPLQVPMGNFLRASGAIPIAMSKFGRAMLEADHFRDVLYVPHGIDTKVYKPKDRVESRKAIGFPKDAYLVGMVAANKGHTPSRKCFPEALEAFKAFSDNHPDAMLYLHTEATGKVGRYGGVQLIDLAKTLKIDMDKIIFPDQYRMIHYPYPEEHMAAVYSSLDVLLAPSMGEGFGIPTIESQACGTPVIASDFSAQPELVGAGWLVEASCRFYTPMRSWQILPDVSDIVAALNRSYGLSEKQVDIHRTKAREFAEGYDIDKVFDEYMLPAVNEVFERFGEAPKAELIDVPSDDAEKVSA